MKNHQIISRISLILGTVLTVVFMVFYFTGNVSLPILQGFQTTSSSNVEHFSNSIDYANQATRVSNSGGAFEQVTDKDIRLMVNYYKQALEEAKQVDIVELNSDYTGFGDHYSNEFIKGVEMFIEGYEQSDTDKFLQGQALLDQWGIWFSDNIDNIRKL